MRERLGTPVAWIAPVAPRPGAAKTCVRSAAVREARVWERLRLSRDFAALALTVCFVWLPASTEAQLPPPLKSQRLASVQDYAFALGEGWLKGDLARHAAYDLMVVDGPDTRRDQVLALQGGGRTVVLAYVSVGTIERYRWWYRAARPYRLEPYDPPFSDEWFADVSKRGFRDLIRTRVVPRILRKGFDGLFLDNTDMIESHRGQTRGMRLLIRGLSRIVRDRGKLLFTQNGEDTIGPVLQYYDGWNREDVTWTYDGDAKRYRRLPPAEVQDNLATLSRIRGAGVLVMTADYVAAGDAAATAEAVHNSCSAGAIPFVSDIFLTREPPEPFRCT
jgi:uncharacterized protein (TIGR01370 family)